MRAAGLQVITAERHDQMLEMLRRAHEGGVTVAFGTDTGVSRHGDNAKEFVFMVEAGMPVQPEWLIETSPSRLDAAARTGLLPGVVLTVRRATRVILSPVSQITGTTLTP